jgi:hypothetical protein
MQIQGIPEAYLEHNVTATRVMLLIVIGTAVSGIYVLPSIVGRGRRNAASIKRMNLLLGWTVIGWILAMIWAIKRDDV